MNYLNLHEWVMMTNLKNLNLNWVSALIVAAAALLVWQHKQTKLLYSFSILSSTGSSSPSFRTSRGGPQQARHHHPLQLHERTEHYRVMYVKVIMYLLHKLSSIFSNRFWTNTNISTTEYFTAAYIRKCSVPSPRVKTAQTQSYRDIKASQLIVNHIYCDKFTVHKPKSPQKVCWQYRLSLEFKLAFSAGARGLLSSVWL